MTVTALTIFLPLSCRREQPVGWEEDAMSSRTIEVMVSQPQLQEETRAVTETTLSGFASESVRVSALKEDGTVFMNKVLFNVKSDVTSTSWNFRTNADYVWPSSGGLTFFSSNWSRAYQYNYYEVGDCILEDCSVSDGDIVAAYASVANGMKPTLNYNHIFARLYRLSLTAPSGGSTAISSIDVRRVTSGSYSIKIGWVDSDDPTWTGTSVFPKSLNSTGDILAVPGTVLIKVVYTVTVGGVTTRYVKESEVTLEQGKKTTVTGTLTADDTELFLQAHASDWTVSSISTTF